MRRASVLVLALLGLLSGFLTVAAPAQAGLTDPMVGAPAIGTCYDLTKDEIYAQANHADPVDCATSHTFTITAVQQLPDGVAYEPKEPAFVMRVLKTCFPALNDALGVTPKQRRYTDFESPWFMPTAAERSQGARWFSCGAAMLVGPNNASAIPQDLDIGDPPYAPEIASCLTNRGWYTTCSRKHGFGNVVVLGVGADKYPSDKQWYRMGLRRCDDVVKKPRLGYRWTWPSKYAWKAGDDHNLSCYSVTSS